jgi:hypothetical protein
MKRRGSRWIGAVLVLLVVPLLVSACGSTEADEAGAEPAVVEHVKGSDAVRVRLTAEAAKRLGIQTTAVRSRAGGSGLVIPYDAVLYDPDGKTWTYTSPKPLVFQRQDIRVDRITGGSALLSEGPRAGARVVTVGAEEIWGVEYGGIEED